jgi:hypothetical protein
MVYAILPTTSRSSASHRGIIWLVRCGWYIARFGPVPNRFHCWGESRPYSPGPVSKASLRRFPAQISCAENVCQIDGLTTHLAAGERSSILCRENGCVFGTNSSIVDDCGTTGRWAGGSLGSPGGRSGDAGYLSNRGHTFQYWLFRTQRSFASSSNRATAILAVRHVPATSLCGGCG